MKKFLSIILLLTTFWSFQIGVAYKHYHYLSNGSVVEHAHPFRSTLPLNGESPHHTFSDFALVGGGFVEAQATLPHYSVFLVVTEFLFQPFTSSHAGCLLVDNKQPRAPPVFFS